MRNSNPNQMPTKGKNPKSHHEVLRDDLHRIINQAAVRCHVTQNRGLQNADVQGAGAGTTWAAQLCAGRRTAVPCSHSLHTPPVCLCPETNTGILATPKKSQPQLQSPITRSEMSGCWQQHGLWERGCIWTWQDAMGQPPHATTTLSVTGPTLLAVQLSEEEMTLTFI